MTVIKGKGYLSFNKFFKTGRIKRGDKLTAWFNSIVRGRYARKFTVLKDGRLAERVEFQTYIRSNNILKNKTWQIE